MRLMRPANIVTSVADVLAGIAISGFFTQTPLHPGNDRDFLFICLSTMGLYGGGIVFNDVFDAALDKIERPERPIPSGLISLPNAVALGSLLLLMGLVFAALVNKVSGIIALLIVIAALVYDKWGKHHPYLGPPNMGLCRGLNLLLGVSIIPSVLPHWWYLAFIPIIYISAITMISRGEVHGSHQKPLIFAAFLYALVIVLIFAFAWHKGMVWVTLPFLLLFAIMIFKPLLNAVKIRSGEAIGKAVKAGVIALILMNGAWAAASGTWWLALAIVLLLPLSIWLSRIFAVT